MYNLEIIHPAIFPADITSGVTLKNPGANNGRGFSISVTGEFDESTVEQSRELLARNLDTDLERLHFQNQVHSDTIKLIPDESNIFESDGMITNRTGDILCISIADCCAILCYDIENIAIGAFHSGWRGTQLNIASKGIKAMSENFGTKPENLLVYLSPCASVTNYEVGEEFATYFPGFTQRGRDGKFYFDNTGKITSQLKEAGVPESNIEISDACTILFKEYHSYRRDKEKSGRMAAFIGLKELA